ncbi:MAG: YfiR family protein [Opitutaceae bacterium]|jgi:preprotein translocase subunit Sec61beta
MLSSLVIRWRRLLFASLAACGFGLAPVEAQSTGAAFSADAVKAAYLVNFIRFTEWPASAFPSEDAPFVIGVAGNRELEEYLWKITGGKPLQGRKVRIVRLANLDDAANCQLLYIQSSDSVPLVPTAEWLSAVRKKPVLTIANEPGFIAKGGIINFYTDGNNLRFEISPTAALAVGLQLSSRLLALARIVRPDAVPPVSP